MRFYTTQHRYSCGIDLHARTMYVCILNQLAAKHGKAKALSILAHKLGRAVYDMLKRQEAFNSKKFFSS